MRIILPGITSLVQHNKLLETDLESYRPNQCPKCEKSGLWRHGYYTRKADYERMGSASLNPIAIPRFYCSHCRSTCSVLPECIPPYRHYPWLIQQAVLLLVIAGRSYQAISAQEKPSRWTIKRWLRRLQSQFVTHADHWRARRPSLGRISGWMACWQSVLKNHALSSVMLDFNRVGMVIP